MRNKPFGNTQAALNLLQELDQVEAKKKRLSSRISNLYSELNTCLHVIENGHYYKAKFLLVKAIKTQFLVELETVLKQYSDVPNIVRIYNFFRNVCIAEIRKVNRLIEQEKEELRKQQRVNSKS